jgi:hypothetical protein
MDDGQRIAKGTYCNKQYVLHGSSFTVPTPNTLSEREDSVKRLTNAVANAEDGGRKAKNELKAARIEFNELFGAYRDWVNQRDVALGDATKINDLGLTASTGEAHRANRPVTPVIRAVTVLGPKLIHVECPNVTGTMMYTFFVAYGDTEPDFDDFRFLCNDTSSRPNLNVKSSQRPWVRMLATNSAGMSEYSNAMSILVV